MTNTTSRTRKAAATASQKLYTIHPLEEYEIDTRVVRVAALDEDGARKLTEAIQATSVRLWLLVTEAHDRKAHLALGYETWADYVKAELNMSESRSYQYLDTGHVMKALAAGGVDIERADPPPTRVVARVKDRLTDVKRIAKSSVEKGEDVDQAIRALAREPRKKPPGRPRGVAAAQAAAAASTATATEPPKVTKGQVTCPACKGSGKVDRSLADTVKDLMSKIRPG